MNDLSIIIVSHNTKELLEKCLNSLLIDKNKLRKEIFVVDNGSIDASIDMVRSKFPEVKLIINTKNLGFAKANNQGIKESNGRYTLLLNSDAYFKDENALSSMVEFMDTRRDAGIVGPKLLNTDGSLQFSCHNLPSLLRTFIEMSFMNRILHLDIGDMLYYSGYDRVKEVGYVSGACFMIRREVIEKIGLLDERFFMYAEEADFCMRAKKKGWKVYFTPKPVVFHTLRGSTGQCDLLYISKEKLRSTYLLFKKHYGKFKARLLLLMYSIYFILRLLISIRSKTNRKLYIGLLNESLALTA